jgi:hypothetical protein
MKKMKKTANTNGKASSRIEKRIERILTVRAYKRSLLNPAGRIPK